MASAAPSPRETSSLEEHLTCSVCLDTFEDPVTTDCGHSFCKNCLKLSTECNNKACPMCMKPLSRTPDVNIILRDIVQQQKLKKTKEENDDDLYTGKDGDVACGIWMKRELKAEQSRPVCLGFHCATHPENNSLTERLKGHRLVEPVKNLDDGVYLKHGHPWELYSGKQHSYCLEDGPEEVVSTEDKQGKKKSFQVCHICGWSNMTTYQGLRIHQGKKGCTPTGIRIPKTEQYKWQKLDEVKVDLKSMSAKRLSFKEENLPEPPGRKIYTNSNKLLVPTIPAATATISRGYNSTFATSQSAYQRATKSKPAHQQQDFPTLPQVNRKPPLAPKPTVRPKEKKIKHQTLSQIADYRGMTGGQKATAAAAIIKEEPKSPVPIPPWSFQRPIYTESGHQLQDSSAALQVHGLAIEPPRPQDQDRKDNVEKEILKLELQQKIQMRKEKRRNIGPAEKACENKPDSTRTSSQTNSASGASTKEDPRSYCETAESDFPTAMKVGELVQMFTDGATQETAVQPKEKDGEDQKMSPAHHQTVPDSESTDKANTAPAATADPISLGETTEPDFSTGMKVKELAWMFSAVVQLKEKPRKKQTPSQVKFLVQRFSSTAAQGASVQPNETDRQDQKRSQKVPDSTGARMNPVAAEATNEDEPKSSCETAQLPEFSTGVKVKELARMFSATAE